MPMLNCLATTCMYNKDEYCSKNDIKVGGSDAKRPEETCCESFIERNADAASNAYMGQASEKTEVGCEACECKYNEAERCCADKIGIAGSHACKSEETECGTFKCKHV